VESLQDQTQAQRFTDPTALLAYLHAVLLENTNGEHEEAPSQPECAPEPRSE
jgi:hypothetical protein